MAQRTKSNTTRKKRTAKKQKQAVQTPETSPVKKRRGLLRHFSLRRSFGLEVLRILRLHFRSLLGLLAIGWLALLLVSGFSLQRSYADIGYVTKQAAADVPGDAWRVGIETIMMTVSLVVGSVSSILTEAQQLYVWLVGMFVALTVVWLLRHRLAGDEVTLRDGLYNAGAPALTVTILMFFGLLQLAPVALSVLTTISLIESGIVSGVVWSIVAWIFIVLPSVVLSLYWLSGTLFAVVIATIPGTYPGRALKMAKQAIAGRRLLVTARAVQLAIGVVLALIVAVLPFVALDRVLHQTVSEWLVIGVFLGLAIGLLIYCVGYLYLLYRKVIDERA